MWKIQAEFVLPPSQRNIPLIRINVREAKEAFRLWESLDDKNRY